MCPVFNSVSHLIISSLKEFIFNPPLTEKSGRIWGAVAIAFSCLAASSYYLINRHLKTRKIQEMRATNKGEMKQSRAQQVKQIMNKIEKKMQEEKTNKTQQEKIKMAWENGRKIDQALAQIEKKVDEINEKLKRIKEKQKK